MKYLVPTMEIIDFDTCSVVLASLGVDPDSDCEGYAPLPGCVVETAI